AYRPAGVALSAGFAVAPAGEEAASGRRAADDGLLLLADGTRGRRSGAVLAGLHRTDVLRRPLRPDDLAPHLRLLDPAPRGPGLPALRRGRPRLLPLRLRLGRLSGTDRLPDGDPLPLHRLRGADPRLALQPLPARPILGTRPRGRHAPPRRRLHLLS